MLRDASQTCPWPMPVPAAELEAMLRTFSACWTDRHRRLLRVYPMPWHPGVRITPDMRQAYEQAMPVTAHVADLAALARRCLPHPSWIPRALHLRHLHTRPCVGPAGPWSLPDLWAKLPDHLSGLLTMDIATLVALLCALADPPRYGTAAGRYPEQCRRLCLRFRTRPDHPFALLDACCGVGHGLAEAFCLARRCGVRKPTAMGLTREPLEAWMASRQCLPHAPRRQAALRRIGAAEDLLVTAGDLLHMPWRASRFDIILCNGLIGGPMLDAAADCATLLTALEQTLTADGVVMTANRFHSGHDTAVNTFLRMAMTRGWSVQGDVRDALLTPP